MVPKVSVVIPFYCHADWLEEAMMSVFSQNYPEEYIEVLVILDGPTENIDHIKRTYQDRAAFIFQEHSGAASARNRGIDHAVGDYIAFLDADDIWTEDKLAVQVAAMEKKGALWSYMSYETFGNEQKRVAAGGRITNRFPQILCSASIATPTVMVRRSAFVNDPALRFDCSLRSGEDYELWIRLSCIQDIFAIDKVGAKVRIRQDSTMRSIVPQLRVRALLADRLVSFSEYPSLSYFCRKGYQASKRAYSLFNKYEHTFKSVRALHFFAAALYLIPYTLFKIGSLRDH